MNIRFTVKGVFGQQDRKLRLGAQRGAEDLLVIGKGGQGQFPGKLIFQDVVCKAAAFGEIRTGEAGKGFQHIFQGSGCTGLGFGRIKAERNGGVFDAVGGRSSQRVVQGHGVGRNFLEKQFPGKCGKAFVFGLSGTFAKRGNYQDCAEKYGAQYGQEEHTFGVFHKGLPGRSLLHFMTVPGKYVSPLDK